MSNAIRVKLLKGRDKMHFKLSDESMKCSITLLSAHSERA